MNKAIMMLALAVGLAVVFYACKNDTQTSAPNGTGKITGTVNDSSSGALLSGVTVTAQSASAETQSLTTDASGTYSFSFSTDSSRAVTLTFTKSGFRPRIIVSEISSGAVTTVNVAMSSSTPISGGTSSGLPATINLVSAIPTDISVFGVGGSETSYLTWEVRDSVGLPIDAAHADTLTFRVNSDLGGGEYVYPVSIITNAQGRAVTSLSSGVRSGPVQVVATVIVATPAGPHTITSQPARIVIHSGFADQAHFSVAPAALNFPSLFVVNNLDLISVLVGDIYANPVATNTAVYFTTRAGVIMSSAFTSASGQGSANLISGNPFPVDANALTQYGNGYHYVVASTLGRNGVVVKDSILVLWTGASEILNVNPDFIDIPNGGSEVINFQVSDYNGNTLTQGTAITVTTTGAQASVAFGLGGTFTIGRDINLPRGALTQYSCIVTDSRPDTTYASVATLSISVTSAGNGNASTTIGGTIH